MSVRRWLIVACGLLALCTTSIQCCNFAIDRTAVDTRVLPGGIVVRPYLQLGDPPPGGVPGDLRLLWQTEDVNVDWAVEYRPGAEGSWRPAEAPVFRPVVVPNLATHRVYRANLKGLEPGGEFAYRLKDGDRLVFSSSGHAPKAAGQPCRVAIFGDCAAGTVGQRAVAFQAYRRRPDFVLITGDIVYTRGGSPNIARSSGPCTTRMLRCRRPVRALLRSTLFVGAPGNHDVAARDLEKVPDGLAYFFYWDQPLNGPIGQEGGPLAPTLVASDASRAAFLRAAGPAYPRMANFSFEYGNAHWTVLDSNPYVDWTDPDLRDWLERDLAEARDATWRFVAFHHPPFNSSRAHFGDQRMRVLAEVFEAGRVDVVWNGHVHNYQRTHPLTFRPDRGPDGKPVRVEDKIPGRWTLDTTYDGRTRTRPRGVIYVITGGGGATLYNLEQQDDPASWQPYTCKFVSRIHSLTVADIDGPTLTVRQVSASGQEVDRFVVTKSP